jgi:hypothetical protein
VTPANDPRRFSAFFPVLLGAATLVLGSGLHTIQLLQEADALAAQRVQQEPVLENAKKLRARLESLASGLATLANQGNASAKTLVAELGARGIAVRAPTETPKQ